MPSLTQTRRQWAYAISQWLIQHPFKGSIRLREALCKLLIPPASGRSWVPTLYGFDIIVNPITDHGLEDALYYCGTYEAGTLWVMSQCLGPGDVFIDVGSNIGLMTLFAAHAVKSTGQVYAFEPDPDTFAMLQQNIQANQCGNVHAFNLGLGTADAIQTLYRLEEYNRGATSFLKENQRPQSSISATITQLDQIVARCQVPPVRMVKIDVEGWELDVLEGGTNLISQPTAPILCIEYDRNLQTRTKHPVDLYDYLLDLNDYQVFKLRNGKESISRLVRIQSSHDLPNHDNIFFFLPAHLTTAPSDLFQD